MRHKILIIDDEEDYCSLIQSYLSSRNYRVLVGSTIKECLKLLEKEQPDILLLDNNLPDGKGWDMIESILTRFPSLKVYLISAYLKKNDPPSVHQNITVWEKPLSLTVLDKAFPHMA